MSLAPEWRLRLIGLLLIATVGVGGYVSHTHRATAGVTAREGALVATVAQATVAAHQDSAAHVVAERAHDRAVDTLHVRIVAYDTIRAQVILDPESPRDTAFDIAILPGLVREADSLRAAAVRDTIAAAKERATADSLDRDRRVVIAAQDTLITLLRAPRPRLSGVMQARYDPIAQVPGAAAHIDVRTVGAWSLGLLGEYRAAPGERAHGYLTLSHPLF